MDRDEQAALEPFEDEWRELRTRHANDPPLEVLRAAAGEVLPSDLQASASAHLAKSRWSRALVEGSTDLGELSSADEARLLERIKREGRAGNNAGVSWRLWWPVLAACSVAALVALMVWPSNRPLPDAVTTNTVNPVTAKPAPTVASFALTLEKPAVKLSPRAFAYRGGADGTDFVSQLKPALDAFRQDDYRRANDEFSALSPKFPQAVEISFYQGVARLFINDVTGADASLAAADQIDRHADGSFASDIAWYRAIADERLGRVADARAKLLALCSQVSARQTTACEAAERLK
jgi:hypothetical protein